MTDNPTDEPIRRAYEQFTNGKIYPAPPDPYATITSLTRMLEAAQQRLEQAAQDLAEARSPSIPLVQTFLGDPFENWIAALDDAYVVTGKPGVASVRELVRLHREAADMSKRGAEAMNTLLDEKRERERGDR